DEVLLGGPEALLNAGLSGLIRRGQVAGPIELAGIADPGTWDHTSHHRVTLTLSNLTGSPQALKAFWYLAKPNDRQPWMDAAAGSAPFQTTLGPWATKSVVLEAYRPAPVGHWWLSAWVQNQQGSGAFIHSDALWLAQPVRVI